MKNFILIIVIATLVLQSCSKRNDFDIIVEEKFENCKSNDECIIDLSSTLKLEWDTMYLFTNACSLSEIDSILGFHLSNWIDVGDRIVLIKKNKVVYYQEWFPYPNSEINGVVAFNIDKRFIMFNRYDAIFSIRKVNGFYLLTPAGGR